MTGALLALLVYSPIERAPFRDDIERISVLMTEGAPANWTNDTVAVPGFLSDGTFNLTKIEYFANTSLSKQRSALGVAAYIKIRFFMGGVEQTILSLIHI